MVDGITPVVYMDHIIVGLNAVASDEEGFELSNPLLAVNINTPEDLKLANRIAKMVGERYGT